MIVLSVLLMPAMIIRSWQGYLQMALIDLPLFVASTMSLSTFYLVSQKELFPKKWWRAIPYVPFLMALGVGLTITNTLAVLQALFGYKTAFARTPKYRVKKKGRRRLSPAKVYRRKRLGIVPWFELALGAFFVWTVWYAVGTEELPDYSVSASVCVWVLVYGAAEFAAGDGLSSRGVGRRRCTKSHIRWGSKAWMSS